MIFYTADLHFHYEPFLPSRPFDTVEASQGTCACWWTADIRRNGQRRWICFRERNMWKRYVHCPNFEREKHIEIEAFGNDLTST